MDVRVSLIPSRKLLFWNSAVSVAAILSDPERPLPICCLQRLYNKHSVPSVLPSHRPAPIRETLTHIQLFTGLSTSVRFIHFLFLPAGRRRRRKWCRSSSVSRCQTSESPPTSELTDQMWAAGMMFLFLFCWCEDQKVPPAGFIGSQQWMWPNIRSRSISTRTEVLIVRCSFTTSSHCSFCFHCFGWERMSSHTSQQYIK